MRMEDSKEWNGDVEWNGIQTCLQGGSRGE